MIEDPLTIFEEGGSNGSSRNHAVSKEEQAYRRLKAHLDSGSMVAGHKIVYRELELLLGMSKTPILGALARLAQEGIVKLEHNRGYYVRKLEVEEIRQLYDIRIRMEELAIEYAIANIARNGLAVLRSALDAYVTYDCPTYDARRLRLDLDFHLQIAHLGGNPFLVTLLKQLYDQTRVGLPVVFMTPMIPKFKSDHLKIYEAIEARDLDKAKQLIRKHEWRTLSMLQGSK